MRQILVIAAVAMCLGTGKSTAGDIVLQNVEGRSNIDIEVGKSAELLVIGRYSDLPGLPHAEFRIAGLPKDWTVSVTPHFLALVALGDPFLGGTNIGFGACNPGENGEVVLFRAGLLPIS